jgi:hypothetical protein
MRKWIWMSLLMGATLTAGAQEKQTDSTLRAATTKICDCLNKKKGNASSMTELQTLATECITTSAMTEFMALATERNLDPTDQEAGRKLGTEVAMDLLKMKCPAFMDIARMAAEGKIKGNEVPPPGTLETDKVRVETVQHTGGTVLRVDKGDLLSITVRDNKGTEQKFYWIDRFPESDSFTGAKADKLKGSKVMIQWTEREIYSPATGAYRKVKVIQGID